MHLKKNKIQFTNCIYICIRLKLKKLPRLENILI